ncbi:intracellular protease/amidase [Klebsiella michiganensis]|uniref:Intracellular protease/amidase n=1 Tax=Klebsiella michiganensis TaxID=1134687 RepID=A0A7H4PK09_9ENTR|nr:intracellular protease/amidase [Klebsiella michiganensis]
MVADSTLTERAGILYDAVVLPGGPQGSVNLAAKPGRRGVYFGPRYRGKADLSESCSAAARVLGGNGLLKGRRYVCSGELWQHVTDGGVRGPGGRLEDGNLISGKGLGHVFDFSFTVAARLLGG